MIAINSLVKFSLFATQVNQYGIVVGSSKSESSLYARYQGSRRFTVRSLIIDGKIYYRYLDEIKEITIAQLPKTAIANLTTAEFFYHFQQTIGLEK